MARPWRRSVHFWTHWDPLLTSPSGLAMLAGRKSSRRPSGEVFIVSLHASFGDFFGGLSWIFQKSILDWSFLSVFPSHILLSDRLSFSQRTRCRVLVFAAFSRSILGKLFTILRANGWLRQTFLKSYLRVRLSCKDPSNSSYVAGPSGQTPEWVACEKGAECQSDQRRLFDSMNVCVSVCDASIASVASSPALEKLLEAIHFVLIVS